MGIACSVACRCVAHLAALAAMVVACSGSEQEPAQLLADETSQQTSVGA